MIWNTWQHATCICSLIRLQQCIKPTYMRPSILIEVFHGFRQFVWPCFEIVQGIRLLALPPIPTPIRYSLNALTFGSVSQSCCHMLVIAQRWCVSAFQGLEQGFTNRGFQIAVTTKFFTMAPDICGSSVWNILRATLLAPTI